MFEILEHLPIYFASVQLSTKIVLFLIFFLTNLLISSCFFSRCGGHSSHSSANNDFCQIKIMIYIYINYVDVLDLLAIYSCV